jgi:hypothetical protein
MKTKFLSIAIIITILLSALAVQPGFAEDAGPTATETITPTAQESPTPCPTAQRPLLVIGSYNVTGGSISPGQEFDLTIQLFNMSPTCTDGFARDIILQYSGGDFLPIDTGGVRAYNEMDPQERISFVQRFVASSSLSGSSYASLAVNVSYTNLAGTASYSESFNITIPLNKPPSSGGPARPTPTPTMIARPQLVISGYGSDIDPLQPGSMFTLNLAITNLGTADSRSVTMVLGGGSADNGTPGSGGVSGGSSDLSIFAPLGSSNLVFLGDLPAGDSQEISVPLVVNVTANPAAYAFKISFVYDDTRGQRQSNDQIITLLVYQLPQVEIGVYRDPGIFMTGNMNLLPLQITTLGRKATVLGNIKVTAENADVTNNVSLVGALEPGGYFTLDANVMPFQAGPLDLVITVNYTDDFNQTRTIVQNMSVEVQEMPPPEVIPGGEGEFPPDDASSNGNETFWQKILRFFRGLFGLDSAPTRPEIPSGEMPTESIPVMPLPGPKG